MTQPDITMYDSVVATALPADSQAVAGYVAGLFPDFSAECQRFPDLAKAGRVLSIAVTASEDAEALDIENGDAVPDQAPSWVRRQQARGIHRPVVYSSLSEMPAVLAALARAGIARGEVRVWTAHYTGVAHFCSPHCGFGLNTIADATQYTDRARGVSLDASLCSATFFGPTAPPVKNTTHYEWFDNKPHLILGHRLTERTVVQQYDKYRALQSPKRHPHRVQLALLRRILKWQAGRVARVAINEPTKKHKPSWGRFHRGWRYQNLLHRSQGRRLA